MSAFGALLDEDAAEGRERNGAERARLQSDARHKYRRYTGVAGSDQSVSVEILCGRSRTRLAQHSPMVAPDCPAGKIAQTSRVGLH